MSQMEAEAKGHYELLDKKAQGLGALVAVRLPSFLPTTGPRAVLSVCACLFAGLRWVGCGIPAADAGARGHDRRDKCQGHPQHQVRQGDRMGHWRGAGNGSSTTADFIRSLTQSLPPTMEVIEKVAGVDLPKLGESKAAKE